MRSILESYSEEENKMNNVTKMRMSLKQIKKAVRKAVPALDETSDEFHAAVCMIVIINQETFDAHKIAEFTKYPAIEVAGFLENWNKNGYINKDGTASFSDWFDDNGEGGNDENCSERKTGSAY